MSGNIRENIESVTVLGDGAWGIAIAILLARHSGLKVRLWSAREESGRRILAERCNSRNLPGIKIPEEIELGFDAHAMLTPAQVWITAIPTVHLRDVLRRISPYCTPDKDILSLTKGIEQESFLRPTEILRQCLAFRHVAVLSGPSHAEEVVRGEPASVVVAGEDGVFLHQLQELLNSERFRVYSNNDLIGTEVAGALKNVIAIAAGICQGLGFGDNARAALITRGLEEMNRYGVAMGASPETFRGLAGLGDLITTCYSPHGRNRALGVELAKGRTCEDILAGSTKICEGVTTAKSVVERAYRMGIEMPISEQVYRVLYKGLSPKEGLAYLMSRRVKAEGKTY